MTRAKPGMTTGSMVRWKHRWIATTHSAGTMENVGSRNQRIRLISPGRTGFRQRILNGNGNCWTFAKRYSPTSGSPTTAKIWLTTLEKNRCSLTPKIGMNWSCSGYLRNERMASKSNCAIPRTCYPTSPMNSGVNYFGESCWANSLTNCRRNGSNAIGCSTMGLTTPD